MLNRQKVSDETLEQLIREGKSQRQIASEVGLNRRTVERRVKMLAVRGLSPKHDMLHTVPEPFVVKGTSTLYDSEGQVVQQWVKSRVDDVALREMISEAIEAMVSEMPVLPKRCDKHLRGKKFDTSIMVAYPIGDAHIGMRAWGEECGDDWDLEIAERTQCAAMDALVKMAPDSEEATIINLGDWFHYDSMIPVTPRSGHHLESDGRYAKVIRVGIKVMRQCIESALQKHKRVRVVNVVGNHDETGALWLAAALAHIYEANPRVSVDTSPSLFNYIEFGKVLVGLHHGHSCKADKLPGVMATDMPEAWGRTKFRYWYTGHVHHESKKEFPGCTVETFNTLAFKDAYATGGGWRSKENMKAITLHKEYGEVARITVDATMFSGK